MHVVVAVETWLRLHGRRFRLSPERFDAIRYAGIAQYRVDILVHKLVPIWRSDLSGDDDRNAHSCRPEQPVDIMGGRRTDMDPFFLLLGSLAVVVGIVGVIV